MINLVKKSANSQKLRCRQVKANESKIDKKYVLIRVLFKFID